jgi:putative spermidine/putrescine transport system permease protein
LIVPSAGSRALATQSSANTRAVQPWTQGRGYALLAAAPCLYLAVFFVWPLARVALRSVMQPRPGIGNYAKILFSGPYMQILFNTLEIAAIVTSVSLLIA